MDGEAPQLPPGDSDLVERAGRGDADAYGALVRRYQDVAVRVGALILGDAAEAEDAAQEAFVKAYYRLGHLRAGSSFRPWLLRIVANEARNRRDAARRRADRTIRAWESGTSGGGDSPAEAVLADERRRALWDALRQLGDHDRLVIGYRYFVGLSEAEMAQALGCPPGTVKSRLSRALGRLRRQLRAAARWTQDRAEVPSG
jgi:RNA polymerase sigma factor (sigma-70 family)